MDVSNIDIGFDFNAANPGAEEVELTFDLAASSDLEKQDVPGDSHTDNGMPNLLKYICSQEAQEQDEKSDEQSAMCSQNSSAEPQDQLADSVELKEEFSQVIANENHRNDTEKDGLTHQIHVSDPPLPDLLQNECSLNHDLSPSVTIDDQEEPSTNPVLADLLTAAMENLSNNKKSDLVQLNLADEVEKSSEAMPPSGSEVKVTVPNNSDIDLGAEMKVANNEEGTENKKELTESVGVENSLAEISNHGDDSIVNDGTVGDSLDTDDVAVTTIQKNDNQDDEEFDFELPEKKEVTYDTSVLRTDMQSLEVRVGALKVYEEGRYSAEPLETLQVDVQRTISDSQSCFCELNDLQKSSQEVPKEHPEYGKIRSWLSAMDQRLRDIQRLAQLKHSMVQERMREQQASLAVLEQANASAEPDSVDRTSSAAAAAAAEWDAVQTVTPEMGDGESTATRGTKLAGVSGVPMVTHTEVVEAAQMTFNLDKYKSMIKTSVPRKGFGGFLHRLFGTKLNKNLLTERDIVFCLAACPYQEEFPIHWQVLQTIYRTLTGAVVDCPRYGSHWEQIGFQGNDPATDLRGCGFLALIQLLYMVSDPMVYPLTKDFYRLSIDEIQNFPMCIMGINMTRIVIQSLREDNLNKECNKRKSVFEVINELYVACWLHICQIWKTQHKTISDTGFVMRSVETAAKKNPQGLIKALNTHLAQHRSKVKDEEANIMTFQAVCDLDGN